MLYVAHSSIAEPKPKKAPLQKRSNWAMKHAYRMYEQVLEERAADIKEIQKYFPGWLPPFEI